MAAAVLSSQVHITFIPPVHFSIFIVQRGIIIPFIAGMVMGIPVIGMLIEPIIPIPRSMVIMLFIVSSFSYCLAWPVSPSTSSVIPLPRSDETI